MPSTFKKIAPVLREGNPRPYDDGCLGQETRIEPNRTGTSKNWRISPGTLRKWSVGQDASSELYLPAT
jgi:hypothetical protein